MDLRELLAKANAKAPMRESASIHEDTMFDELDDAIQNTAASAMPPSFNMGLTKDGNQLQVGDPVTGIHRGQRMSGQVLAVQDDKAVVEWKDRETTKVKINTLTLTNVDDDYEEETMYIEAAQPIQSMGFDKESFVEDTDLECLLRERIDGSMSSGSGASFRYGVSDDI